LRAGILSDFQPVQLARVDSEMEVAALMLVFAIEFILVVNAEIEGW
jgi:hypothetical protein